MLASAINTIILLGSIQGFLLAFFFLSKKRYRRKSNRFLAILLIATALSLLQNYLYQLDISKNFAIVPMSFITLIPVSYYFLTQSLISNQYKLKPIEKLIFIPLAIELFISLAIVVWYFFDPQLITNHPKTFILLDIIEELVCIVTCFIVFIILIKQINAYHRKLKNNYAEIGNKNLLWLRNVLIASFIIWGFWMIPYIWNISQHKFEMHLAFVWLAMAVLIYWMAYFVLLRRDIFEDVVFEESPNKPNELSSKTEEHYQRLLLLIEDKKLYTDPNLNMTLLAEETNLSNGYLSQIINQKEGKNFFDFVNTYRVEEVKKKLADSNFDHYSILGIGLECGFKSKSTFNAVFKKMTGKTPSDYKKQLNR